VGIRETPLSEPLRTYRKLIGDVKTGGFDVSKKRDIDPDSNSLQLGDSSRRSQSKRREIYIKEARSIYNPGLSSCFFNFHALQRANQKNESE